MTKLGDIFSREEILQEELYDCSALVTDMDEM